jgi:ribonuclease-3
VRGSIYELALTHRSYAFEAALPEHNERLEFLGDAILGAIVTDLIFRSYPELAEGEMARLRASVVNTVALADIARSLGLGSHIRLGKGEESSGGRDKSSLLADTFEALVGAVRMGNGRPSYRVASSGPDHAKSFSARVYVGEQLEGEGAGRSKKEAEQNAARDALVRLAPGGATGARAS